MQFHYIKKVLENASPIFHNGTPTCFYRLNELFDTCCREYGYLEPISEFASFVSKECDMVILDGAKPGEMIACKKQRFNRCVYDDILRENTILSASNKETDIEFEGIKEASLSKKTSAKDDENSKSVKISALSLKRVVDCDIESGVFPARSYDSSYERVKSMLIDSFHGAIVCPVSSLHSTVSESYGTSFDFRRSPCKIGIHSHSSLPRYLRCCDDTFSIATLSAVYVIRTDPDGKMILRENLNLHAQHIHDDGPESLKHLLALLASMFPLRVTVNLRDVADLLENVYHVNISETYGNNFVNVIKRLNNRVVKVTKSAGGNVMCTLTPDWSRCDMWKNNDRRASIEDTTCDARNTQSKNRKASRDLPAMIFGDTNLVKMAALNIPRRVQIVNGNADSSSLFVECAHNNLPTWMFVIQGVNLSDAPHFI